MRTLCPRCWAKYKNSFFIKLLLFQLSFGPLGLFFIWLWPDDKGGWALTNLFLFQIFLIFSILPHELGHAWMGKRLGWRVFRIYIGSGKTLFKRKLFGFETEFRAVPAVGLVAAAPRNLDHYRSKRFAFVLAGPATNLVLVFVALAFGGGKLENITAAIQHVEPMSMLLCANLLILIGNLTPRLVNTPIGKFPSDGKQLLQALQADRNRAEASHAAWFILEGVACREKDQYEEARSWFQRGVETYPYHLPLLNDHGVNLINLGKFNEARDCFLKILPRVENQRAFRALVLNNISYVDALLGGSERLEEADRFSVEAMASLSWNHLIRGTRGAVLLELGRVGEAVPVLRDAMRTAEDPRNKATDACWLAIAEARNGNLVTAQQLLDEATKLDPICYLLERARLATRPPALTPLSGV